RGVSLWPRMLHRRTPRRHQPDRPRARVVYRSRAESNQRDPGPIDASTVDERRCETSSGDQLDPNDMLDAVLTGHVRRVVFDAAGVGATNAPGAAKPTTPNPGRATDR